MDKDAEAELICPSQINYKTPQKSSTMIDCEKLLDKINQLTTKPENVSYTTKVNKCPSIKHIQFNLRVTRFAANKWLLRQKFICSFLSSEALQDLEGIPRKERLPQ